MAITVSNKGAITEHPMVVVLSMAAAAATSTDMVPLTVTENKHQSRHRRGNRGNADYVDYIGIVIVIRVAYAPPLPAALVGRGTTACFVDRAVDCVSDHKIELSGMSAFGTKQTSRSS